MQLDEKEIIMAAMSATPSLLNRLSLAAGDKQLPEGYLRSKLFVTPYTNNPIVAAAGPVLSLLERLSITQTLPAINPIRENLSHELGAFRSRLGHLVAAEELNAIAYYLLCATVDEILSKNYMRINGVFAEFSAFTPPSPPDEPGPEEYFFEIVHYIKERPSQYLDLIELSYYCLIAGFEGKHHAKSDGRLTLDDLLEELFQTIQNHRVNKTSHLFKKSVPLDAVKPSHKPLINLCVIAFSILLSGFIISYLIIEKKAQNLQSGHQIIAMLDHK